MVMVMVMVMVLVLVSKHDLNYIRDDSRVEKLQRRHLVCEESSL